MFKFLILLSFSLMSTLLAEDFDAVIAEANQSFEQANSLAMGDPSKAQDMYAEVIMKYEYVLGKGAQATSALHMNLGNAYWFSGDKGRAILNYQRGLHLAPDNNDLHHNLSYARKQITDEIEPTISQKVVSYLSFWHRWPVSVRLSLLFIFNSLFFVTCAKLLAKPCRVLKYVRLTSAFFTLVFALSVLTNLQNWDNPSDGVVVATEVTSRQGNGHIYEPALNTPLHSGIEFKLIEQRPDWYHIELSDGTRCWIASSEAELIVESL